MSSIRKKLTVNENDSKNTRMDIASAGVLANWRPDEIAHMSRFDKIASLMIEEAKKLGLADVNDGLARLKKGKEIRSVILLD